MRSTPDAYGSAAKIFHWVSALLILLLLATGFRSDSSVLESTKIAALRVHVPVAILVLVLTGARIVWWLRYDTKPEPLETVPALQEWIATWTHRLLYAALVLLLASGIALSAMSGLPLALFGDAPMPDLAGLPPRAGHGLFAKVLAALILLHALGALYHHIVLKDATLRRMWF